MRVTNQIITNKTLSNINKNKNSLMNIEEQYQTGKKIQKPSEDPVIAVRALKLRNTMDQITQYYKKNVPDAKNWMSNTEAALKNDAEILATLKELSVTGSQDTLTPSDRKKIYDTMYQYRDQLYTEGNASYAGRYLMTGYKTQTSLTYLDDDHSKKFTITEKLGREDIETNTVTVGGYATGVGVTTDKTTIANGTNLISASTGYINAHPPVNEKAYVVKLAYDDLDKFANANVTFTLKKVDKNGKEDTTYSASNPVTINYQNSASEPYKSTDPNAYSAPKAGEVKFIADTGELVLSEDVAKKIIDGSTNGDVVSFEVTYDKSNFKKNDLRPQHYFNCIETPLNDDGKVNTNGKKITYVKDDQKINYETSFNQRLDINVQASDCLDHKLGRVLDGIMNSIDAVTTCESKIEETKKQLESATAAMTAAGKSLENPADKDSDEVKEVLKYTALGKQLDTELALKKKVMQERFSRSLDSIEDFQDGIDTGLADLGAREQRLNLTNSRLETQKDDARELKSTNEDADMTETIINFSSQQAVYNASLNAGAKVIQNSLLDFVR